MEYSIVVEAPDTEGNFTAFNIPCDVLDSDFLMQPINEADYDSETQACVDLKEGKVTSFYSHYVTKRRKKKNVKNCRIESPAPKVIPSLTDADTNTVASEDSANHCDDEGVDGSSKRKAKTVTSSLGGEAAPPDPSFLMAPTLLGTTFGVAKNALSNVAVRRIACGRMPPPLNPPAADNSSSSITSSNNDNTRLETTDNLSSSQQILVMTTSDNNQNAIDTQKEEVKVTEARDTAVLQPHAASEPSM